MSYGDEIRSDSDSVLNDHNHKYNDLGILHPFNDHK